MKLKGLKLGDFVRSKPGTTRLIECDDFSQLMKQITGYAVRIGGCVKVQGIHCLHAETSTYFKAVRATVIVQGNPRKSHPGRPKRKG